MWRPRKRSHGEVDGFGRKDPERGRPRWKVDDLQRDSREISPKRRRITDERGGRACTGGTQEKEHPRPLGYKALEEICNSGSIEDGILDLANKSKRFEALLKSKTEIRPDLMKLVIRAIHLCCSPKVVRENAERLLRVVVDSNFLCLHLSTFISKISYYSQLNGDFLPSNLISRLAEIFLEFFQRFGRDIVDSIPLAQLSETLRELKDKGLLHEDTEVLEKKILQVREYRDELIRQKIQSARGKEDESQLTPPENYRDISVIPGAEDLKIHNKPFLRVNVVNGSYKDQEHYLDVQFRLLREDFILPLREGIRQLQKDNHALATTGSSHRSHAQDVHVYRDVTVLYPVCSGKGMVYRIRFGAFHHSLRRVNWDKCKLLKFGSLLCLSQSTDGFYRPLFATVENRNPRELRLGELEVRFEGVQLEILNRFVKEKEKFDMVESPAFFESYRHVLEGLQEIEPGELPFLEQIVKCSRDVGAPDYENKTNGFFDMSGIIEDEVEGTAVPQPKSIVDELMLEDHLVVNTSRELASVASDSCSIDSDDSSRDGNLAEGRPEGLVNIYDLQRGAESLGFNKSQMRAFKMALSKRFAVIQGPPGTGKTYLGLKIARVLLQSSLLWENEEQRSPILMVSYTNHALDEFLSGLPTEGIVRVGGRCSDKLKCCSLKVRRKEATAKGQTPRRISTALRNVRDELTDLEKDGSLERCTAVLKFSRRGILSFHILKTFMSRCHVRWFEREQTHGLDDLLCHWLGVHIVASRDSKKKLDPDVSGNEDFQMQVSVRNFSNEEDFEDDGRENAIKPSEVTICNAEDTKNPAVLRKNLQQEFVTSEDGAKRYHDLKQLSVNQRWKLYRFWVQKTENHYLNQLQKKQPDYERVLARKFELMLEEDFHVLRNARVIGMTTTCAARYRRILQRIRPKIVLVEEAAEVLEAHIITSLTKGCQHLILIGDHQQLRPKPAVYELAKKYKLDVSLFERMVKVGIQCERLSVQHRMRPEIAALMKDIYDDLENHESVEKYEDIKGMKKNMFFIDHCHLEHSSDGTHSHVNEHEAKFLVALCRYLLQQGYSSNQITLLTTYTGQMFAIRDCLQAAKIEELTHVRLTTVDNFQGEESDIILLSLVRSNEDEKVGFISDVNRACVALSRAKKGLYCIGNFALLSKHSEIWGKIVPELKTSGSIGSALPFVCQIHHDEMTAETAEDFSQKASDGGCQRPCEVRLECGHACKRLCHPYDTEHLEYRCGEPCAKKIEGCDHDCPKLCYQKCETDCSESVEKTLPSCGHKQIVRCGMDSSRVQCTEQCDKILPTCSHRCQSRCGQPCTKQCLELVKRTDWPCGHDVTIACSATQVDCSILCEATLECGHQCSGTCGECRMGRVHKRCGSAKCDRGLVCSHFCKEPCRTMSCPPCTLPCENRCVHAKCKHQCGEACVPCSHKCAWRCAHYLCDKRCGELCNRPRCDKPCNKILKCGSRRYPHRCRGLCGEVCICAVCEKNGADAITEISLGGEDEEDALFIQLPECKHIFAVSDLDRYMDSTDDRREIQLKSCPRCTTVIRRSLRYGNVIKQQLHDIEQVKRKVRGEADELIQMQEKLQTRLVALKCTFNGEDGMKEWERLERAIRRMSKRSKTEAVVTENQVTLMERFCAMSQKLKDNLFSVPRSQVSTQSRLESVFLQGEMEYLKNRFMSERERVTPREFRDINLEYTGLNLQLELCLLEYDVTSLNLTLNESSRQVMRDVRKELSSVKLIETEKLDELLEKLAAIRESYPCLSPLTSEERKQIVSAMNLSKGHWFKCRQGHIYAIGDCGGAMERSTCPECGAVIGGANHRLEEGNELAPEMDGASHPAWSEQANLQNYVIVDEA